MKKQSKIKSSIKCPKCGEDINIESIVEAGTREAINKELELQKKNYEEKFASMEDSLREKIEAKVIEEQEAVKNILEKELAKKNIQLKKMNELEAEMLVLKQDKVNIESELEIKFQGKLNKAVAEEKIKAQEELRAKLQEEQKAAQEFLQKELDEKTTQLKEMNTLKAEMSKLKRDKDNLTEELEIKFQNDLTKSLTDEKVRIKQILNSEHELKIKEYQKQLDDQKLLIEEMRRKSEQGSMQLQGEVQELLIEEWLRSKFPGDTIDEVGKGDAGADCLHCVNTPHRPNCGLIYYESKRTKTFRGDWIEKFKQDIKEKGADIGVLVTQVYPNGMDRMGLHQGIYVCSFNEFKGLSVVLRESIIRVSNERRLQENKGGKAELLYDFITSAEFANQAQSVIRAFEAMKIDLVKEKSAMQKYWVQREKRLDLILSDTANMFGSIQAYSNQLGTTEILALPMYEDEIIEDIPIQPIKKQAGRQKTKKCLNRLNNRL